MFTNISFKVDIFFRCTSLKSKNIYIKEKKQKQKKEQQQELLLFVFLLLLYLFNHYV